VKACASNAQQSIYHPVNDARAHLRESQDKTLEPSVFFASALPKLDKMCDQSVRGLQCSVDASPLLDTKALLHFFAAVTIPCILARCAGSDALQHLQQSSGGQFAGPSWYYKTGIL